MRGFIDLHSHWVAGVDDGARTVEESRALLLALRGAGFDRVVATPHMRPGMFDNTAEMLRRAHAATVAALAGTPGLPALDLASEHYFDDVVFERFINGGALPYPGGHAVLVEFQARAFPAFITHRFFDLRRRGLTPVIAHPERYEPVWKDIASLEPLLDGGAILQLDVAALAGKYGRAPKKAAEKLLDAGWYYLAASDAHTERDVRDVKEGIEKLVRLAGQEGGHFLLSEGPREVLEGRIEAG